MNASQKCGDDSRGDRNTEDAETVAAASTGRDWRNKQAYHWLSLMRSRACAIDTAPSHRESSIHLTFCHGCVDEILGQSAASVRVVGRKKKKKPVMKLQHFICHSKCHSWLIAWPTRESLKCDKHCKSSPLTQIRASQSCLTQSISWKEEEKRPYYSLLPLG